MNISIRTCREDGSLIFEKVKAYFSQEFPDKEYEWKCSETKCTTSLQVEDKEIIRVFEELVKKYPELDVEANYSEDIREEDRSAQWWRTVRIYSEKKDGEKEIVCSSNTYWN